MLQGIEIADQVPRVRDVLEMWTEEAAVKSAMVWNTGT
jgi:hypothetical protein